jgi:hypothetical protein
MTQSIITTELPAHSHTVAAHTHNIAAHKHGMQHKHNMQHTHNYQHSHGISANTREASGTATALADLPDGNVGNVKGNTGEPNAQTTAIASNTYTQDALDNTVNSQAMPNTQGSDVNVTQQNTDALQTGQVGNGAPRSNLPPYWVLAYIMRIG